MNTHEQKSIRNLLADYRPGMELEVRFVATQASFAAVYKVLQGPKYHNQRIEPTINIISDTIMGRTSHDIKHICSFSYVNGVGVDTYYQKRALGQVRVKDTLPYKISLSSETPCKRFASNINSLVRFKLRYCAEEGPWRFDLTATRQAVLKDISGQMAEIKRKFIAVKPDSFLALASELGTFELELEYIGKGTPTVESLEIIKETCLTLNPAHSTNADLAREMARVNKLLGGKCKQAVCTLKNVSNQALQLTKATYKDYYPLSDFYVTEKIDGERAYALVDGNRCNIIYATRIETIGPEFVPGEISLFDIEMYQGTAYIIDAMVIADRPVYSGPFSERMSLLEAAAAILAQSLPAVPKRYTKVDSGALKETIEPVALAQYPYPTDGIMFTEGSKDYHETKNLKWKTIEHNTIDFLARACPSKLIGKPPYKNDRKLHFLFSNINHQTRQKIGLGFIEGYDLLFPETDPVYYPIQFSPSMAPLAYVWYTDDDASYDGKVVEMILRDGAWELVRVREDKAAGNDFRIAEQTFVNYVDLFPLENLWDLGSSYFMQTKDDTHKAETAFKRIALGMLFDEYFMHSKWVIDLAGGRGADIGRWQHAQVRNTLFIDIDSAAIAEIIRRKYGDSRRGGGPMNYDINFDYDALVVQGRPKTMTIHALTADLTITAPDLIAQVRQFGVSTGQINGINCGFALHYLCDSVAHIKNILEFVSKMLFKGSYFIFSVMDGQKVFDLLQANNGVWKVTTGGVTKFCIRRHYTGTTLANTGQTISVLLPMSNEEKKEPLCNIDYVVGAAAKNHLEFVTRKSFWDAADNVESTAKHIYDALDDDDRFYIGLYSYVVLRRT